MNGIRIGRQLASKYLVALVALFVFGLGLGLVVARLAVGEPKVNQTEYAILTAQVYEREHNLPAATERLASVGITEPSRTLPDLARRHPTGTTEQSREAQSLRDLGRAFGATVDEPGVATSSQPIWLVTVVVFVFVLLLGGALVYRVLGVRVPKPNDPESRPETESQSRASGLPVGASVLVGMRSLAQRCLAVFEPLTARRGARRVAPRASQPARPASPYAAVGSGRTSSASPATPSAPATRSTPDWGTAGERRTALAPRGPARVTPRGQFRFRSSYDFGDEPYDEIHPIADPRTMALVGACGVSAVHRLQSSRGGDRDGGPERYWGFTAWVQDYASDDQQLRSIGIVSRWAYVNCGAEIDLWLRSGQVDELRQVDVGSPIRLETTNISAALTVEEYEHGSGSPADSYIERLTTQFEVTLRPRQETSAGATAPSGLGSQGSTARA